MEGIKYLNLIEIGPVVIEKRGAENGELAVPVNNTLVSHMAFLAADTRPCVLIRTHVISEYCSLFPYFYSSNQTLFFLKFKIFVKPGVHRLQAGACLVS